MLQTNNMEQIKYVTKSNTKKVTMYQMTMSSAKGDAQRDEPTEKCHLNPLSFSATKRFSIFQLMVLVLSPVTTLLCFSREEKMLLG